MKIRVDRKLCAGHALCAAKAPDVYSLDDDGFCNSDGALVAPGLEAQARLGARHCPEGAITLVEDDAVAAPGVSARMLQKVVFIEHNGIEREVMGKTGSSAMEVALDNNVPGIVGECGGCCNCATCHGYVDSPWFERLPAGSAEELELVSYAFDPLPNSRLTCQIKLTPDLDGMVIRLPKRQI
jgi:2Fe-2S ferredoxin